MISKRTLVSTIMLFSMVQSIACAVGNENNEPTTTKSSPKAKNLQPRGIKGITPKSLTNGQENKGISIPKGDPKESVRPSWLQNYGDGTETNNRVIDSNQSIGSDTITVNGNIYDPQYEPSNDEADYMEIKPIKESRPKNKRPSSASAAEISGKQKPGKAKTVKPESNVKTAKTPPVDRGLYVEMGDDFEPISVYYDGVEVDKENYGNASGAGGLTKVRPPPGVGVVGAGTGSGIGGIKRTPDESTDATPTPKRQNDKRRKGDRKQFGTSTPGDFARKLPSGISNTGKIGVIGAIDEDIVGGTLDFSSPDEEPATIRDGKYSKPKFGRHTENETSGSLIATPEVDLSFTTPMVSGLDMTSFMSGLPINMGNDNMFAPLGGPQFPFDQFNFGSEDVAEPTRRVPSRFYSVPSRNGKPKRDYY